MKATQAEWLQAEELVELLGAVMTVPNQFTAPFFPAHPRTVKRWLPAVQRDPAIAAIPRRFKRWLLTTPILNLRKDIPMQSIHLFDSCVAIAERADDPIDFHDPKFVRAIQQTIYDRTLVMRRPIFIEKVALEACKGGSAVEAAASCSVQAMALPKRRE